MALTDSLISYWSFDSDATDNVGSNDLTVNGATHDTTTKKLGAGSYSFDGTNDYLKVSTTDCQFSGDFTFTFWFKHNGDSEAGSGDGWRIISFHGPSHNDIYTFRINDTSGGTNGSAVGIMRINGGTIYSASSGATTFKDSSWHFGVLQRNGTTLNIYVDNTNYTATAPSGTFNDTTNLTISRNDESGTEYFGGHIDDVGMWNRALSSAELTELYNSGSGLAYPFSSSTNFQINIGDVWKDVEGMQINIGDAWKTVEGAQINIGDTWKTIF